MIKLQGYFFNSLQFIVETYGQKKHSYWIKIPLMIQPLLIVEPNILDFGICSNHKSHVS